MLDAMDGWMGDGDGTPVAIYPMDPKEPFAINTRPNHTHSVELDCSVAC